MFFLAIYVLKISARYFVWVVCLLVANQPGTLESIAVAFVWAFSLLLEIVEMEPLKL